MPMKRTLLLITAASVLVLAGATGIFSATSTFGREGRNFQKIVCTENKL